MTASDAFNLNSPYLRGAWVMHTLRYHLGDDLFFELLKRWAYPNPDDLGNEDGRQCRLVDTEDLKIQAEEVTGVDLDPFWSVFFREASYPQLLVNREYNQTTFEWQTEQDVPLDLNVPILINGEEFTVEMENGYGSIAMSIADELVIDPNDWILMQDPDIILGTNDPNIASSGVQLNQNFPNPFSETTQIAYTVSKTENISIVLYDILGNAVKTLVNKVHQAGDYSISLHRSTLSDGVYYYQLQTDKAILSKQLYIID